MSGSEMSLWFPMFWLSGVGLSAGGVFDDCSGGLRHGVLADLPRQQQVHRGLYLSGGDRAALVVGQASSLFGNALENIHHEGIHVVYGLLWETQAHVDLLQHRGEIAGEAFNVVGAAAAVMAAVAAVMAAIQSSTLPSLVLFQRAQLWRCAGLPQTA